MWCFLKVKQISCSKLENNFYSGEESIQGRDVGHCVLDLQGGFNHTAVPLPLEACGNEME